MNSIFIALPTTTSETTVSVPCSRDPKGDSVWHCDVFFGGSVGTEDRVITVCDGLSDEGEEKRDVQAKLIKKGDHHSAKFEFHIDRTYEKLDITLDVYFNKDCKGVLVSWDNAL